MIVRAEHEALVAAVHLDRPRQQARLGPILAACDAGALLDEAYRHAVLPLLARAVAAVPDAPPDLRRAIADRHQLVVRKNLQLAGELAKLQAAFDAADVPVLPFKGPALAVLAHGDLALRAFSDLDLVVPRAHAAEAADVLTGFGYAVDPELSHVLDALRRGVRGPMPSELAFTHDERHVLVELHMSLDRPYRWPRLDVAGLLARSRRVRVGGREVPTLAAGDLLAYLCIHGAKHGWERLGWVADVAWLLANDPPDPGFVAWARARGLLRIVHTGVRLAHERLGATLPAGFDLQALGAEDPQGVQLANLAWERVFREHHPARYLQDALFNLRLRDPADRARILARLPLALTDQDFAATKLPPALFPAYHAIRPFRLVRTWVGSLFRTPPG